jgi:hypothetical protein
VLIGDSREIRAGLTSLGLTERRQDEWIDADESVCVVTRPSGVFVAWVDVAWPHPSTPVRQLQDVQHVATGNVQTIEQAINTVRRRRAAALRICRHCEQRFTPGHMIDEHVCQGCATQDLGVVY